MRDILSADRLLFARLDGDDDNDGSANNSFGAFRTVQHAVDEAMKLDLFGHNFALQVGPGSWSETVNIRGPLLGGNGGLTPFSIVGDPATPGNVFFDCYAQPFILRNGADVFFDGLKLRSNQGHCLHVVDNAKAVIQNVDLAGAGPNAMLITANQGGYVANGPAGGIKISGGAKAALNPNRCGKITIRQTNIVLANTPNFTQGFVFGETGGQALVDLLTFSGTGAIGKRYSLWSNSVCNTQTLPGLAPDQNYLPGTVAGEKFNGGQYN